ncbi:MAG: hypothetical protein FJW30_21100 [Acidobacteria bacterium]|nr:hypothetical protein [Acidobacteriota bacterium]
MICPKCQVLVLDGHAFCGKCGRAISNDAATVTVTTPRTAVTAPSASTVDEGRFPPGTLLNQRYRVIDIVGVGGMGEVYRANDLILGQPVALKFLPSGMARDESALTRFRNEVRTARQVSHPNVCRVYDLGEVDGAPYLSMEYIDGEDLSTLIKRIGRLPADKGVEFARQLCAGLAAAHDKGVLHRDLKPSNILISSKGHLAITDFGLAGLAEHVQTDARSGTPAYMAPEQISGLEVTSRSDIYSLGLVLFEMFSGKRAHTAATRAELQLMKETPLATAMAEIVKDLDPAIERVIERCLQPEPLRRPASALAVSAALPGGDPLAAALAAGETPSPEMVANSGDKNAISPRKALLFVGLAVAGWIGVAYFNSHLSLLDKIPFDQPRDALAQKAKEVLVQLGYDAKPADTAYGFSRDEAYIGRLSAEFGGKAWDHLSHTRPSPVYFWYRGSPEILWPTAPSRVFVREFEPPVTTPGMTRVVLDPEGRLRALQVLPQPGGEGAFEPFDWNRLLRLAEIDPAKFTPAPPAALPLVTFDQRASWKGRISDMIPHDFRVEAAAYRGKPVYFNVFIDWGATPAAAGGAVLNVRVFLQFGLIGSLLLFTFTQAYKNFKNGRGDRIGAYRLALFVAASALTALMLQARYASIDRVVNNGIMHWLAYAIFDGVLFGAMYLALEPPIRRRWPDLLVGWTRAVSGQFRDPLLGRHVLYGMAASAASVLLGIGMEIFEKSFRLNPVTGDLDVFNGVRFQLGAFIAVITNSFTTTTLLLFLVVGLTLLLRRLWLGALAAAVLIALINSLGAPNPWLRLLVAFLGNGIAIVLLLRFGYLAASIVVAVGWVFENFPPDLNWNAWYADTRAISTLFFAGLLGYGYFTATRGYRETKPGEDL